MPRVAVTTPYFDFFPALKAELAARYPGTRFRTDRRRLEEDDLIAFLEGAEAAVIGLDRFTDRVCARLPDLKVISMCSAGVDHIDPAILNKYGIKMWWAAGINKVSVAELAVCYMVFTVRRLQLFCSLLVRGQWKGPIGFGTDLRGRTVGIDTSATVIWNRVRGLHLHQAGVLPDGAITAVRASSPSKATVTIEDGRVFRTENGGVTWSAQ